MLTFRSLNFSTIVLSLVLSISSIADAYSSAEQPGNFLVISDVHMAKISLFKMNFAPTRQTSLNDLDEPTFLALMQNISQFIKKGKIPQPEFIIFLGDAVGHFRLFPNAALSTEQSLFNTFSQYFPNTPLFYVFGNNDSLQGNYGPFNAYIQKNHYLSPLDAVNSAYIPRGGFLSTDKYCRSNSTAYPCLISENKNQGYYSAYIKPCFRLLALNTVMFSPLSRGVGPHEAEKQLHWLASELNVAKNQHETVLLVMHIPPGINIHNHANFWQPKYNHTFLTIINTYHKQISGILAGHTHFDEIKLIQNTSHQNTAAVYLIAALSTSHGNAPSFRTFSFARNDGLWELKNYNVYYFLKDKYGKLLLKKLYDFNTYYCCTKHTSMLYCLRNFTIDKMKKYFLAGNSHYIPQIDSPGDVVLSAK